MAEPSRYNVGGEEVESVLKNKLNIKTQGVLEDTEALLLSGTYTFFLDHSKMGKVISKGLIRRK